MYSLNITLQVIIPDIYFSVLCFFELPHYKQGHLTRARDSLFAVKASGNAPRLLCFDQPLFRNSCSVTSGNGDPN